MLSVFVIKQKNLLNKYDNRKQTEFIALHVEYIWAPWSIK